MYALNSNFVVNFNIFYQKSCGGLATVIDYIVIVVFSSSWSSIKFFMDLILIISHITNFWVIDKIFIYEINN